MTVEAVETVVTEETMEPVDTVETVEHPLLREKYTGVETARLWKILLLITRRD